MAVAWIGAAEGCHLGRASNQVNAPLHSPYPAGKVWAVAPMANETGVSVVDPIRMAEVVAAECQQIEGVDTIPVHRVLDAMRAMDIGRVETPTEAIELAMMLHVDGVVVGSITAYDPYSPPRLGMILQLYSTGDRVLTGGVDTETLRGAPTDGNWPGLRHYDQPVASAAEILDAADNRVLAELERFARGRTDVETAYGWRRYLVSMELYAEFVSHRLLGDLLHQEYRRLTQTAEAGLSAPRGSKTES